LLAKGYRSSQVGHEPEDSDLVARGAVDVVSMERSDHATTGDPRCVRQYAAVMIPDMAEGGGARPEIPRSTLYDYLERTEPDDPAGQTPRDGGEPPAPGPPLGAAVPPTAAAPSPGPGITDDIARARRHVAALLGEFRRTPVLVPLDDNEDPLVGDYRGVRWIYAFSDESALARFAIARGEGSREWAYQRVLGARLLDTGVPATGVPCGVALDVGSEDDDGVLFPPVVGIVPDAVALDAETAEAETADADAVNGEEPR